MIILHVTYTTKPGEAENFIRAIEEAGIDKATRAENGSCSGDEWCGYHFISRRGSCKRYTA